MSNTDTPADRLLAILDLDPSDLAPDMVQAADGHDARLDMVKSLLALAAAIASQVGDDMIAVGDGYDVDRETGETHSGNGTEDEGRALALHQYACAAAANKAAFALWAAEEAFDRSREAADAIPSDVTAEDFVKAYADL